MTLRVSDSSAYSHHTERARYRSTVMATSGVVSSAHPLASYAGVKVLQSGGNAADAAIATNAVLAVTQPHMCGLGGDLFYLTYMKKEERVTFLNGSGRAAKGATIDFYLNQGLSSIPPTGPLACVTVPGCVDAWGELHERYGSKSFKELIEPAADYALGGVPVSHNLSRSIREAVERVPCSEWRKVFTPQGKVPLPGETLTQTDLGKTLRTIGEEGRAAFYSGDIAEKIAKSVSSRGGPLSVKDLSSHQSNWGEPVHTRYRDFDVYETAPNSQAITALIALNIVEEYDLRGLGFQTSEEIHVLVEASKMAYEDRDRFIGDPKFVHVPVKRLLSKEHSSSMAERIRLQGESSNGTTRTTDSNSASKRPGDTTYFAVVDRDGNCVSCIQSLYANFGSGVVVEGTGVTLQNRGSYFSLNREHHNRLDPGKRTFHTLCASLTLKDDEPFLVFGSMGGDGQPQTHLQVFTSIFDHDVDIQEAIESPRWFLPGTIYEPRTGLHMERRFPADVIETLRKKGHAVTVEENFWDDAGHAQGILIKRGVKMGGADPRGDGAAIGY